MSDIEREEMIEQAHKLYDDSRNLLSELRWQRTYFCRGSNIITKQEKIFNIWIFDECLKRLEERKVGEWENTNDPEEWFGDQFKCSVCGWVTLDNGSYCPHCGAEMRGGEND